MKFLSLEQLDRMLQFNRRCASFFEGIGVIALLSIMFITSLDVAGAKLFSEPIPGSLDIVMLAQSVAISFGMAATLISGGHVCVGIFVSKMAPLMKTITGLVSTFLSLALFVIIVWQMTTYGFELFADGEVSPTAHIPIYPFAFGIAIASVPICIELALNNIKIICSR